ncbi:right-handed parallel beta-helix repeat-containing protein [bacterium]|nr:right-handed parallel beta-helix repeat-containing protein [bacterium]
MKKLTIGLILVLMMVSNLFSLVIPVNNQEPGWIQSIQLAIMTATDGDTILVYPGTYLENVDFLEKNILVTSLYYTTQDPMYIQNTIIDGSGNGNVIIVENTSDFQTSLRGFTIQNGNASRGLEETHGGGIFCQNAYFTLADLIIKNNTANRGGGIAIIENSHTSIGGTKITSNQSDDYGGGIYVKNSNVQIQFDNEISSNNTSGNGGGAYITDNASVYFIDTYIEGNTAYQGAGIYVDNAALNFHNGGVYENIAGHHGGGIFLDWPTYSYISYTPINLNTSPNDGGGVYLNGSNPNVNIKFQYCAIRSNSAARGGGIDLENCEQFTIENCLVHENLVSNLGAGIRISHCDNGDTENKKIINTQISSNTANSSGGGIDIRFSNCKLSNSYILWNSGSIGGGIFTSGSDVDISECHIGENIATYSGGGLHFLSFNQIKIEETIIYKNTAPNDGAGIESYGNPETSGLLKITNCLIRDNHITSTGRGGGIYTIFNETRIINSDIVNNFSDGEGEGEGIYTHADCDLIFINSISWGNDIISHPGSDGSLLIRNSDIENCTVLSGSQDIDESISQDPLFIDPNNYNYYLSSNSPCIDTGTLFFQSSEGETIVDVQSGEYYGNSIDMGCYESSEQLFTPVVNITIINNFDVELNWEPVLGATYYKIYRSTNPENFGEAIITTSSTTWIDYGIVNESDKYFYRVTACN